MFSNSLSVLGVLGGEEYDAVTEQSGGDLP
jgi:hypothetical protein